MENEIKILIIEDREPDAELMLREFERNDVKYLSKRVETPEEFLKALEEFAPDIILSDYSLPDFDGMSALQMLKDKGLNIPFVIVTGSVSEEVAVDCIKAGAYDYVLKEHLVRIVPASMAALERGRAERQNEREEKERKAALERARKQEAAVVRAATSKAVISGDLESAMREIAEAAAGALEVERVGIWMFGAEDGRLECKELYERSLKKHSGGMVLQADDHPEYFRCQREGRAIDASDARTDPRTSEFSDNYLVPLGIKSMLDAPVRIGGEVRGVICHEHVGDKRVWTPDEVSFAVEMADQVAQAIGNYVRRKAEEALKESEERYRKIFDTITDSLFVIDSGGVVREVNPAACRQYGYRREELIGLNASKLIAPAYLYVFDDFRKTLVEEEKEVFYGETLDVRKDGSTFNTEVRASNIIFKGEKHFLAVVRDVTGRVRTETTLRKAVEELKHFKDMTVGRENRMIELKEEVNRLSEELGRPAPYDVGFKG